MSRYALHRGGTARLSALRTVPFRYGPARHREGPQYALVARARRCGGWCAAGSCVRYLAVAFAGGPAATGCVRGIGSG